VVNTGYPASSDFVDVTRLDLRFFDHGALVSGRRAARAVLRELDVAPRPTRSRQDLTQARDHLGAVVRVGR
jgi:hypothetical protein